MFIADKFGGEIGMMVAKTMRMVMRMNVSRRIYLRSNGSRRT